MGTTPSEHLGVCMAPGEGGGGGGGRSTEEAD